MHLYRDVNRFGGLKEPMPLFAGMGAILFFASMGLPALCGFVGEFSVLLAAWNLRRRSPSPAILRRDPHRRLTSCGRGSACTWARTRRRNRTPTCRRARAAVLLPFVVLAIALGVFPQALLFNWMDPSVSGWVANMSALNRWGGPQPLARAATPPTLIPPAPRCTIPMYTKSRSGLSHRVRLRTARRRTPFWRSRSRQTGSLPKPELWRVLLRDEHHGNTRSAKLPCIVARVRH